MDWVKIFSTKGQMEEALAINKPRLLIVGSRRICLLRTEDGVAAVSDSCTHNGESLSKGSLNYLGEIICPWHGHRFNVRTGRESGERSADLTVFPLKTEGDGIFIGL